MGKKVKNQRDLKQLNEQYKTLEEEDFDDRGVIDIDPKFKLKYKPSGELDDIDYHW